MAATDMSPEHWHRVQEVFDAVLARPPEERSRCLDEMAQEAWLRAEVESLLSSLGEAHRFIEVPVTELGGRFTPGSRVGAYKLQKTLGSGGTGRVYLATRADDAFEKRVAIKVLKRGMDTDEVLNRFNR
ncbi:MAG: hypothetical protein AAGD38_15430 [Acidobacteriota bacterium]